MAALKLRIKNEVNNLDSDMVRRTVWDLKKRASRVVEAGGGYIEG